VAPDHGEDKPSVVADGMAGFERRKQMRHHGFLFEFVDLAYAFYKQIVCQFSLSFRRNTWHAACE
jgi:hypothetical protein